MVAKSLPGFGRRLKQKREQAGLSQPELATRVGVHPSDVSRWERDVTFPRGTTLRDICLALRTSADFMLGLQRAPGDEPEALKQFRTTRWGKMAVANGWIEHLKAMQFPMEPTVDLYRDMVKSMLDVVESDGADDAG